MTIGNSSPFLLRFTLLEGLDPCPRIKSGTSVSVMTASVLEHTLLTVSYPSLTPAIAVFAHPPIYPVPLQIPPLFWSGRGGSVRIESAEFGPGVFGGETPVGGQLPPALAGICTISVLPSWTARLGAKSRKTLEMLTLAPASTSIRTSSLSYPANAAWRVGLPEGAAVAALPSAFNGPSGARVFDWDYKGAGTLPSRNQK